MLEKTEGAINSLVPLATEDTLMITNKTIYNIHVNRTHHRKIKI